MATSMPPTATLKVTGNRAAMPDATVSLLKRELPRLPLSAAFNQFQILGEETLVQVELGGDLGNLRGGRLGPSGECVAGLPGMMRMSQKTPKEMRNSSRTVMSSRRTTKDRRSHHWSHPARSSANRATIRLPRSPCAGYFLM